jgi:hypothetical protein
MPRGIVSDNSDYETLEYTAQQEVMKMLLPLFRSNTVRVTESNKENIARFP